MPKQHRTDAAYCRRKGWVAGTVLTVEYDPVVYGALPRGVNHPARRYRVTAVGDKAILVREVYDTGRQRPEERWVRKLVNMTVVNDAST